MRAIAMHAPGPVSVLDDVDLPEPDPGPRDLLVEVRAVSVNPVDTKVRQRPLPEGHEGPLVLGWDAAGVVRAVGSEVSLFAPGDEVWYAGSIARPGSNSRLHAVDERIVGPKPTSLGFAEAAALPLTAITAWELLFDRLRVERAGGDGTSLLVVGAAGGVGSVLVQLASSLTRVRVVATASRPETQEWVRDLGAHDVVDHHGDLPAQLADLGLPTVDRIASLTATDEHFPTLARLLSPQGAIGVIDDPAEIDVKLLKPVSGSLHWEFMFTRAVHQTPDMIEQHRLLSEVSALVDQGVVRTTLDRVLGPIDAATLREAHAFVESGRAKGKVVLEGWTD